MKKFKVLVAALLTVTVVLGGAVPTYAASTDVTIEVNETSMDGVSVTVPSVLPIVFNSDGTNTLPTNWTIQNTSTIAGIHLSEIAMDVGESGWVLLGATESTTGLVSDTKAIKFYVGKGNSLKVVNPEDGIMSATGNAVFGAQDIAIPCGSTQVLSFKVDRGAFTITEAAAKAFDMTLSFNFN